MPLRWQKSQVLRNKGGLQERSQPTVRSPIMSALPSVLHYEKDLVLPWSFQLILTRRRNPGYCHRILITSMCNYDSTKNQCCFKKFSKLINGPNFESQSALIRDVDKAFVSYIRNNFLLSCRVIWYENSDISIISPLLQTTEYHGSTALFKVTCKSGRGMCSRERNQNYVTRPNPDMLVGSAEDCCATTSSPPCSSIYREP